jgi:hypothetical protein
MKLYLLTTYQPDGEPPPRPVLEALLQNVIAFHQELRAAGAWVFAGGLHPASTATVLRVDDRTGEALITDGPFTEGKEHIGGLCILRAPDLDAALAWGRKAARATTLPIEVRPFQEEPEGW